MEVIFRVQKDTSVRGKLTTHTYTLRRQQDMEMEENVVTPDYMGVLNECRPLLEQDILNELSRLRSIKWHIACRIRFVKYVTNPETAVLEEVSSDGVFHGRCHTTLMADIGVSLSNQIDLSYDKILESISRYTREGSGWIIDTCLGIELVVSEYSPLAASSYIPTPSKLAKTRAVVNVVNKSDEMCFTWSILASLYPSTINRQRVSNYRPHLNRLNMMGINYPVSVKDVSKFESLNPEISVSVFGCDDGIDIYPVKVTNCKDRSRHINLLLLVNDKGQTHYCLITDMNRLLYSVTKHNDKCFYCDYCLHRFSSEQLLTAHLPHCTPYGEQKTQMPSDRDKIMYFKNFSSTLKHPFTVYADFESLIVPVASCSSGAKPLTVQSESGVRYTVNDDGHRADIVEPPVSSTNIKSVHVPSGYSYVIVDHESKLFKPPTVYRGDNVIDNFLSELIQDAQVLRSIMCRITPMNMTEDDNAAYRASSICHLCNEPLSNDDDKVRNHCHRSGKFLGAAHKSCNLNCKKARFIPVFFHNLRGYDCHHLIQGLGKYDGLSCIATTSERYVSLTLDNLRFLDTFQFLSLSLDKLVNNLSASGHEFPILKQCFSEHIDLLVRKGVYPYDYVDSVTKFEETSLPARDRFYNALTDEHITQQDYEYAQRVWSTFNISTLGEYHDLYLKTDVLLLAETFESFRDMIMQYYQIDACHFYSLPGLAWNAMLKMTRIKLELLQNIDMHLFIENNLKGGVAQISNRHATANNPYIPDQYVSSRPNSYVMYFDCNNLYGYSMSSSLPYANFRWLNSDEIANLDVCNISDDADVGYILEVDLHYPDKLHDFHSDMPLAPIRQKVTEDMLSPYTRRMREKLVESSVYGSSTSSVEKLLTTLDDKKNYVLHYRNLKLYMSLGLELKAIHRVLCFKQKPWLKEFIDFNTAKRKAAANSFEKDLFKLMNNAVYGKSLENVRKRIDFHLVSDERRLRKLVSTPRLKRMIRFTDDLAGLSLRKKCITLSRPVYVGFSVLDISKAIMYDFHYGYAVAKYGSRVKLLMTDTDSLLYYIQTDDVYSDILDDKHLFDTSDYPTSHPCYSEDNKKVLGKFKDETCGIPISEFIGLRAKCYSILMADDKQKNVAKGVPKDTIRRHLRHRMYVNCLTDHCPVFTTSSLIRSVRHTLYTMQCHKLSLLPYDDKRYILNNGRDTIAYGHYRSRRRMIDEKDTQEASSSKRIRIE